MFFAAAVRLIIKHFMDDVAMDDALQESIGNVYASFSWFIGFVLVFRTGQAYNRYWEGANSLKSLSTEWYDVCSQITCFAETSGKSREEIDAFQATCVRLVSLLHCCALQTVTVMDDDAFEVIDLDGLDEDLIRGLDELQDTRMKTEVVFQWVQRL